LKVLTLRFTKSLHHLTAKRAGKPCLLWYLRHELREIQVNAWLLR
jgi:hypothetical protein